MRIEVADVDVHCETRGDGRPVLLLHGGGVDHREAEACFEPVLAASPNLRRVYPDLPGHGLTPAPDRLRSADDVLDVLIGLAEQVGGGVPVLVAGHSVGGYYAYGLAVRRPDLVAGLALVCPLLAEVHDLPEHRPVIADATLGDDDFRGYFVLQTPEMLERYERSVAPGVALADAAASERIGERWELTLPEAAYAGPTLIVAGRRDSVVGSAAAADLAATLPCASLAVLDDAGHALPHERPDVLAALIRDWLGRAR